MIAGNLFGPYLWSASVGIPLWAAVRSGIIPAPGKITMRLTISIWAAFATVALTPGVVTGQELLPEVAQPTFTPLEVTQPESGPV